LFSIVFMSCNNRIIFSTAINSRKRVKEKKCPVYGGNNREPPSGQVGKRDDQLTSQATIIDVIKTNAITQLLNKWNTVLRFSVE